MRHQRNERHERGGQQGRSQGRSLGGRQQGRQGREEESFGRWQEHDEDRDMRGQSYRSDDYDTMRSDRDYDYGSREYQGLGSSSQTSRDQNQGYGSSYGSRDLDFGSGESTGWGRGASDEESSLMGEGSHWGQGLGSQRRGQQGRFEQQGYGAQRSGIQSYGSQGTYGSQQDIGIGGERGESMGRFMGRGPKGYKRSDERIREDICEVLTRDPQVDASDIDIEVKEGEVTLTGFVPERKMKHQAEDVVEKCMGVKDVTNNLRVRKEEGRSESREGRESREARESSSGESETERGERRGSAGSSASSASGVAGQTAGSKRSGSTSASANPSH
jgi:osmotically-inducible protein OsmY